MVDRLPVAAQQPMRHPPPPPRMLPGDRAQSPAQLLLLAGGRPPRQPLGRAVLPHDAAGPPLGYPEPLPQRLDRTPAPVRGQKFPSANSLSIALSSSASASSFFNRAFSVSNSRSRFAPSAFIPPYWARHRFQVGSLISRCRSTSTSSLPSLSRRSPSRSLRTICSGVCRCRFIVIESSSSSILDCRTLTTAGPLSGAHVNSICPAW